MTKDKIRIACAMMKCCDDLWDYLDDIVKDNGWGVELVGEKDKCGDFIDPIGGVTTFNALELRDKIAALHGVLEEMVEDEE